MVNSIHNARIHDRRLYLFCFILFPPFGAFQKTKTPPVPVTRNETAHFIRGKGETANPQKIPSSPLPRTGFLHNGRSPGSCFCLESSFSGGLRPMDPRFLVSIYSNGCCAGFSPASLFRGSPPPWCYSIRYKCSIWITYCQGGILL